MIRTKEGYGNPVEDGVPDEYAIQFSDTALPSINIGCCEARLFNNADLNKDDADDIIVFQAPENGNVHWLISLKVLLQLHLKLYFKHGAFFTKICFR